jgi:hypothetical protein
MEKLEVTSVELEEEEEIVELPAREAMTLLSVCAVVVIDINLGFGCRKTC